MLFLTQGHPLSLLLPCLLAFLVQSQDTFAGSQRGPAGACAAREQHRGWRSESGTGAPAQDDLGLAGTDKLTEQGLGRISRSHKDVRGSVLMLNPALMYFL